MSANNITMHTVGGYNFYTVATGDKKYIIGGVPQKYKDNYIAEASNASAIILLTSKPEFTGGIAETVAQNPDIEVYATASGLRNIKEIINKPVSERLIKDLEETDGIRFLITPGLPWVDTVSVLYDGVLFSGEMFSGGEQYEYYYNERLEVNRDFVVSALDRFSELRFSEIYPAVGNMMCDTADITEKYREITKVKEHSKTRVGIIYSSAYGFTKRMAEYAKERLSSDYDVYFSEAKDVEYDVINSLDMLIIGTNTINRNAPESVWKVITHLDLVNKRSMPYFVFGSFGWAGDGIKLVDKTLQAMGMNQVSKPVEALFAPSDGDFQKMEKAISKLCGANK